METIVITEESFVFHVSKHNVQLVLVRANKERELFPATLCTLYIYISLEAKGEIVTVVTVELGRTVTNMNDGGRKYPALYLNVIYLFQMHQYLVLPGAVCGVAFFVCSLSTVVVDARTLK